MTLLFAIFTICVLFVNINYGSFDNTISKSVTLTPSNIDQDGVQIDANNNLDVISTDDNDWNFMVSSNEGYHLHITMDETWKFISNQVSTITLKAYINTDNDLIFAFSQNNEQYLVASSSNHIYPSCDSGSSQALAYGDIGSILSTKHTVNDNETNGATYDREYKLSQGNDFDTLPLFQNGMISPLTMSIINNPMDATSKFEYNGATNQCNFESWSTEYPLSIYISGANINDTFSIEKIELELTYNTSISDQLEGEAEGAEDDEDSGSNGIIDKDPTKKPTEIAPVHDETLQSEIEGYNTKTIVAVLIGITACLLIICIILVIAVRKQSIENKKDRIQSAFKQSKANMDRHKQQDLAKMVKIPTNTMSASFHDDNTIQGGHIRGESDIDDQIIRISIVGQHRNMNDNAFHFADYEPNIAIDNDRMGPILTELTEMKQQDYVKDMRPNASYPKFNNASRQNSWSITAESVSNGDFEINLGNLALGNEMLMEDVVDQMHVTPHPMKIPPTAPIEIPTTSPSDEFQNDVNTPGYELGRQASELPYDQDVDDIDPYEDDEEAIKDMVETAGNL